MARHFERKVLVCGDTVVDGKPVGRNVIQVCDTFDAAEAYRRSPQYDIDRDLLYAAMVLLYRGKQVAVGVSVAWEKAF